MKEFFLILSIQELNHLSKVSPLAHVLYILLKRNSDFQSGKNNEVFTLWRLSAVLSPKSKQGVKTQKLRIEKIRSLILELIEAELINFNFEDYTFQIITINTQKPEKTDEKTGKKSVPKSVLNNVVKSVPKSVLPEFDEEPMFMRVAEDSENKSVLNNVVKSVPKSVPKLVDSNNINTNINNISNNNINTNFFDKNQFFEAKEKGSGNGLDQTARNPSFLEFIKNTLTSNGFAYVNHKNSQTSFLYFEGLHQSGKLTELHFLSEVKKCKFDKGDELPSVFDLQKQISNNFKPQTQTQTRTRNVKLVL